MIDINSLIEQYKKETNDPWIETTVELYDEIHRMIPKSFLDWLFAKNIALLEGEELIRILKEYMSMGSLDGRNERQPLRKRIAEIIKNL